MRVVRTISYCFRPTLTGDASIWDPRDRCATLEIEGLKVGLAVFKKRRGWGDGVHELQLEFSEFEVFESEGIGEDFVDRQLDTREGTGQKAQVFITLTHQIETRNVWQKVSDGVEGSPSLIGRFPPCMKPLERTGKRGKDRDRNVEA